MQTTINSVDAFRLWDSRGRPLLEVEVKLSNGIIGRGMAPAGASCGSNEALDLRDGGSAFNGFGLDRAIQNVHQFAGPAIMGMEVSDQAAIDSQLIALDTSPNRASIGGNVLIATSMAVLKAAAKDHEQPLWQYLADGNTTSLPLPEVQIFGGGAHAGGRVDIQDFLVMPVAAQSFDEALCICADIYGVAGKIMESRGGRMGVADEGGWWPNFETNEEALRVLTQSIDQAGYGNGEALISLDLAASEFGRQGRYRLGLEGREFDTDGWLELLCSWVDKYPILSIEDPVSEDDVQGMRKLTQELGSRVQIVGDDFLVTNSSRIEDAASGGCCTAALIKPNQAGTITETLSALQAAKKAGWGTIISARSGESEDVMVTHLAVGWNAGQLKVGSFARSERMAKWNEGLRIERSNTSMQPFASAARLPTMQPPVLQHV